ALSYVHHPSTPAISTLSLHDALPISRLAPFRRLLLRLARQHPGGASADNGEDVESDRGRQGDLQTLVHTYPPRPAARISASSGRSEEHTSELQSRENLVCRLLLENKK